MSNRHRSSRRRTYGRRQHELRERRHRRDEMQLEPVQAALEDRDDGADAGRFLLFGARVAWAGPR
jgi:hypothetical protein